MVAVRLTGVIARDPVSGWYRVFAMDVDRGTRYVTGGEAIGEVNTNLRRLVRTQYPGENVTILEVMPA